MPGFHPRAKQKKGSTLCDTYVTIYVAIFVIHLKIYVCDTYKTIYTCDTHVTIYTHVTPM